MTPCFPHALWHRIPISKYCTRMLFLESTLFLTKGRSSPAPRSQERWEASALAGSGPHVDARVECPGSEYPCAGVCHGLPFPGSGFFFSQRQCDSKQIAQEVGKLHLFSGCGPERSGLNNGLVESNRLLNTHCLWILLRFFHRKEKGPFFPESGTFFSSTQSLSNLEVCNSYKTSFASSLCPCGAKACVFRENRLKIPPAINSSC